MRGDDYRSIMAGGGPPAKHATIDDCGARHVRREGARGARSWKVSSFSVYTLKKFPAWVLLSYWRSPYTLKTTTLQPT